MNERTLCFRVEVHREQLVLRAADKATGREQALTKHVRINYGSAPA
jgi:hypothetical protein